MLLSPRRQNIETRTCHRAACRRKSRSLNGKVLLLLAIFWAVKCLFSHNNLAVSHYYYHLASSPSSPCPSKGYLTNILPEIVCIGGRSILCCSFATAAPASCIHGCVCLSARLSLCTLLITLPSTQQWHNWLLSYPLLRFTLSALYGAGLKHVSLDVKSNSAVLSRGVTAFWTTKMRCAVALGNESLVCRRYTRLFTINGNQLDTPDCSQYTAASQINQNVHNTQPSNYISAVYVIYLWWTSAPFYSRTIIPRAIWYLLKVTALLIVPSDHTNYCYCAKWPYGVWAFCPVIIHVMVTVPIDHINAKWPY